jgi:hypothetical protein
MEPARSAEQKANNRANWLNKPKSSLYSVNRFRVYFIRRTAP